MAVGTSFIEDCFIQVGLGIRISSSFFVYKVSRYSHHLPAGDGRFLGWRGEGGELVLGLLWPLDGGLNHLPGVSGHWQGSDCSGLLQVISRTTGGQFTRGMRAIAAASGGSAPTSIETSVNAVREGV